MFADDRIVAATLAHHARHARRLRLEIPALIDDEELARRIESSASTREGVTHVRANPRTGRVLIEYAENAAVLEELEQLGREQQTAKAARRAPEAADWHADEIEAIESRLATSTQRGLSRAEAQKRLGELGANIIEEETPPSRLALFASQITNVPTVLLLGSTVVSLLLGDVIEAGAIVTVIGLNASIGYTVERHSHQLLEAWRDAELGNVQVVRDGSLVTVRAANLVPGDLLVVRAGAVVSADARVIEAHRLAADEGPLTGESEPVAKAISPVPATAPLAERSSMLYRGTAIASGHGRAIVVATGGATEIARVQRMAAAAHAPKGRLQRRLNALASRLAWSGLAAAAASGAASLLHMRKPFEILRDCVALGVAAIPEGLPVTATAALVRAMSGLRARGVVVRRLGTAETLGAVTVACMDKTGTLTENRMRLELVSLLGEDGPRRIPTTQIVAASTSPPSGPIGALLLACVLNSDMEYQQNGNGRIELAGSSTERALVEAARDAGIDLIAVRERWPRTRLVERHEDAHYVISEHAGGLAFVKGAPEQVVPLCALDPAHERQILDDNNALAADGLRVLAVGAHSGKAWHFLGLVALRDPLRAGSAEALRAARDAGIRTIMLTGDQRATAEAIARHAGITGSIIEGAELPQLLAAPDARARLERVGVIARVTPADKVATVEALRSHGHVVAMIGDGINDAPALRAADVGIAVGARSTDLARQTADVVLERPDLRAILDAVSVGRAVQDNLRRSIKFQAAGNLGEILLAFGASVFGKRLIPSLGILWINLLTDTLPGLALALEPTGGRLLDRPPVKPDAPILAPRDWRRIARDGAAIAAASGAAAIAGGPLAAFAAIGATQFGYAAASRAPDRVATPRFAALLGGSAALHLVAVLTAPARALFRIGGSRGIAGLAFAAGMGAPLYIAWRREADLEIVRRKGGSQT